MIEVSSILYEVMNASGSIAKANVLKKHADNDKLKKVLKFIYDPYNKCCIGDAKLTKALERHDFSSTITDPLQVATYLSRNNTGSDAAANFAAAFVYSMPDEATATMAKAMVTQNLQIGVAAKSLCKVFGKDFIPTVGCMLGTLYQDVSDVKWPCIGTEKLDGIRRILIKRNGKVRMFSRSGHEDTGCVEIIAEAAYLPDNAVFDGELIAKGIFEDNIACRQATSSIANSDGDKYGLMFNIFDTLPLDEFYAGKSVMNAINRKIALGAMFDDEGVQCLTKQWIEVNAAFKIDYNFQSICAVPILGLFNCLDDVSPLLTAIWDAKGEGIMLNTLGGFYEIKRSKELLKLKFTEEKVLTIVDFTEGKNDLQDNLGAFVCEYKGARVGVSGRLSREQRQLIWDNQEAYIGKEIEVDTFGESKNRLGGVSLNCPIFKRFVGQEE